MMSSTIVTSVALVMATSTRPWEYCENPRHAMRTVWPITSRLRAGIQRTNQPKISLGWMSTKMRMKTPAASAVPTPSTLPTPERTPSAMSPPEERMKSSTWT